MSLPVVDFYYDIVSPYSYIAAARIRELDGLADVRWRPCLLGGIFKATANTGPAFTIPAKMPYMFADLERLCRHYGLPFKRAANFPMNSVTVQRALCAAPDADVPALSLALYDAYWGHGIDVSDPAILTGIVGDTLIARTAEEPVKHKLRANTDAAVAAGAFGAPSFVLNGELYFGEDRLFLVKEKLQALQTLSRQ